MNPLSSVGTGELIMVLIIALIFLGPERLPEIARSVGKTIRQFRKALQNMSSEFGEELASVQKVTQDIQASVQAVQEIRNLPQTMVRKAAAPLVEAMDPIKATLEETQKAVATAVHIEDSTQEETQAESESVPQRQEGDSRSPDSPDEPRVVVEDDQV